MRKYVLILLLALAACATNEEDKGFQAPEGDAHHGAYAADGMYLHTPEPEHPEWNPLIFYHNFCNVHDEPSYYSANSYSCDNLNR
ncbi:MAG: hypothetical protein AB8E15_10730 [Bdellovibrionales bacterium]